MSDNNDPFAAFGSDRTVIKPSAGRAPRAGSAAPEAGGRRCGRRSAAGAAGARRRSRWMR
jgi:type VI secretion system protein ImpK